MAQTLDPPAGTWTAADLVARFGAIPLYRVIGHPPPGLATEDDVVRVHDREDRLCELVDGVLLEKTVGTYESYLAGLMVHALWSFAEKTGLGIVLGADGMMRLAPGLVRIPDAAFLSFSRLPQRKLPRTPLAALVPDLAVEVISKGNTPEEMQRKLGDYFESGVRLVWYVDPASRVIRVYEAPDRCTFRRETETLDGGEVLPGFRLSLAEYFAEPGSASKS